MHRLDYSRYHSLILSYRLLPSGSDSELFLYVCSLRLGNEKLIGYFPFFMAKLWRYMP